MSRVSESVAPWARWAEAAAIGSRLGEFTAAEHGGQVTPAAGPYAQYTAANPLADAGFVGRDGLVASRCWCGAEEVRVPSTFPKRLLTWPCDRKGCAQLGGDRCFDAFEDVA